MEGSAIFGFLSSYIFPAVLGFLGAFKMVAIIRLLIDLLPYEHIQINRPERVTYLLSGGFLLLQGYNAYSDLGYLPANFLSLSTGIVLGLVFYWIKVRPGEDEEDEPFVTFGDPFDRKEK